MANPIKAKEIAFNGRLRTYEDPASIGPNDFCSLQNLRYTATHPKSIYGMTVITDTGAPQNIGSLHHFRKGQPQESHLLVHAASAIYDVTASVTSSGTFGTAIWSDTAAGATGRFASTNGLLAYANGVGDTCVWGGDEFRTGGFIVYTSAAKYDYTEAVNNTLTSSGNYATLKTYTDTSDSNTSLLLHCDGVDTGTTFNDSSPLVSRKTVSAYTGVVTSTTIARFGTASGRFPGTGYLITSDHDDFNFTGGVWTIDFWMRMDVGHYTDNGVIYYQGTDASNYFRIDVTGTLYAGGIRLFIKAGASEFTLTTPYMSLTDGLHHVAVVENGNSYYIFIDGVLRASTSDATRAADYTGSVYIGSNSTPGNYYTGYLDEFRVSRVARWTSDFSVPTAAYGDSYTSNVYLGSIMPLSGCKLYVLDSKSGKTVDVAVYHWDGSSWTSLSPSPSSQTLADSTAYSFTWTSTASTSKVREINKTVMYWYKLIFSSATDFDGVTISRCTTKFPLQHIRDFWSGEPWSLAAFLVYKNSSWNDYTANVSSDAYDSLNEGSYAKLVSLTTSDFIVVGSTIPLMGFVLQFAGEYVNKTSTTMSVSYYTGTSSPSSSGSWNKVSGLVDGTLEDTKTLNKSGFVTWTPPTAGSEVKSSEFSSSVTEQMLIDTGFTNLGTSFKGGKTLYPLYYYRIDLTGVTTSADVRVQYAFGIPAQRIFRGFNFPVVHQDRLFLCGDMQKDKNYAICSAYQSPTVLGYSQDVDEFWIGDDTPLVAGVSMFTRYGSTVADVLVLAKQHETYVIDGNSPNDYKVRRVSEYIGCIAPLSMITVPMGDEAIPGTPRNIAIWLSQQGVVAFDGNNFAIISKDIHNYFDPNASDYLGDTVLPTCSASYDPVNGEYVLIVPGSYEFRYSVELKRWFTVDRGSYKLRCMTPVYDTNGVAYTYGAAATKLYRLENGSTMAGDAFTRTLRTGEMALPDGSIQEFSRVNWYQLVGKTMTQSVTGSYYTDTSTTAGVSAVMVSTNSGKRLFNKVSHTKDTQATFHGFQFEVADQFEPLYLTFRYTIFPRELS